MIVGMLQDPLQITSQPLVDGVFRADLTVNQEASTEAVAEHGYWTASFIVQGALFKAYFQSQSEAQEAQLALGNS